jgi:hypothetical protein
MKETTPNDGDHTPSVGIEQAILSDEGALFFSVGTGSKRADQFYAHRLKKVAVGAMILSYSSDGRNSSPSAW